MAASFLPSSVTLGLFLPAGTASRENGDQGRLRTLARGTVRSFLGYGLAKKPPEHSTLSKTRKRLSLEARGAVFGWVLERLQEVWVAARQKAVGVDSTTLEANAAMRAIMRRDDGTEYDGWLEQLAKASGIELRRRRARTLRNRPQAPEEGVQQGLEASAPPRGADHEDEGRQDTPGSQGSGWGWTWRSVWCTG